MSEQQVSIRSIGEAYRLIQTRKLDSKQIWEFIEKQPNIYGEADEYHNCAVAVSKQDDNYTAYQIVDLGLNQYPFNTDLLADAMLYGSRCSQQNKCDEHMKTLLSRPMSTWTWRAFTFLIDYLKNRIDWIEDITAISTGMQTALDVAQKYQQYFPNEERSYVAEYEVRMQLSKIAKDSNDFELATKHEDAALNILKESIDGGKYPAVQCAMKYADLMFEQQNYDEVVRVTKRALEFGEDVSSVRLGYFMYLSAQSKEIQLYQSNNVENPEYVQGIYREYVAALAEISASYYKNIGVRVKILQARSGVPAPAVLANLE